MTQQVRLQEGTIVKIAYEQITTKKPKGLFYTILKEGNIEAISNKIILNHFSPKKPNQENICLFYNQAKDQNVTFQSDAEILNFIKNIKRFYVKIIPKNEASSLKFAKQSNVNSSFTINLEEENSINSIIYLGTPQKREEIQIQQGKIIPSEISCVEQKGQFIPQFRQILRIFCLKNLRQITNLNNPQAMGQQSNFKCSLCPKAIQFKLYACQLNLAVIICEQCYKWVDYQIPFPFKPFSLFEYSDEARKQRQERTTKPTYEEEMEKERNRRNKIISEKLQSLNLKV